MALPAGTSCTLSVAFKPKSGTRRKGNILVNGGAPWKATALLEGLGQ